MNLADLAKAAAEEGVDVGSAPSNKVSLTDGETYLVKAEIVNQGVNQKGTLTFGVMFRNLDGPDNGNRTYWDNWYISPKETSAGFNARTFHYLGLLGVDLAVLTSVEGVYNDQSNAVLTASATTPVSVEAGYEEKKDTPGEFWTRNHYVAATDAAPVVVSEAADEPDDDLGF